MSMSSKAEAAKRLLQLHDAERSFLGYVQLMHPKWKLTWFQIELIEYLDKMFRDQLVVGDKRIRRIMINMPPRHSKSTIATQLFPSYYLGKKPARHVMSAAYSQDLADNFGSFIRAYTSNPDHGLVFPDFQISKDKSAAADWRTTKNGSYLGTGLNGQTTGRPANVLIVDDPIKNRQEAESATYRNRAWDFYLSSLENRKEPSSDEDNAPPLEIVIATRWHPDDLCGRIMQTPIYKNGYWLHVCYPAIFDADTPKERALWEARHPLSELKMKRSLNEREFEALYQQRPYVKGGNLIKVEWWRYFDPNETKLSDYKLFIIAADTAYKKSETSDYNAIGLWGLTHDGDIHLVNLRRFRGTVAETKQVLINMNAEWRGRNLRGIYVEDKSSGHAIIDELKRESGVSVIPVKVSHDKVVRLNAVLPLIQGGRVFLPLHASWLDGFVQECLEFPDSSQHDDQVDQMSMALDVLARVGSHDTSLINGDITPGISLRQSLAKPNSALHSIRSQFGHLKPRQLGN